MRRAIHSPWPFGTALGGGFECSSHVGWHGRRLDLIDATGHGRHALSDYRALKTNGLEWARDGLVWSNIEPAPGLFHWDDWIRQLQQGEEAGVLIIWDLLHFGLPSWIDAWSPDFPARAVNLAIAATDIHRQVTGRPALFCPVNEMSFWSFAGGEVGWMTPLGLGLGDTWKRQLVTAAIAMARAIRNRDSGAGLVWAEPLMRVTAMSASEASEAARVTQAQFQCYDWLLGRACPELGGAPELADWLGFNFYPHNQRTVANALIGFGEAHFQPLNELLKEAHQRYPRHRMLLTETGAEGSTRAAWLAYVADELADAMASGVPLDGACLYPVTDYPGWDDGRICPTGLFGMASETGVREGNPRYLAMVSATEAKLSGFCRN